jgi:hypothetical protein
MKSQTEPRLDAIQGHHPQDAHHITLHIGLIIITQMHEYAIHGDRKSQQDKGPRRKPSNQMRIRPVDGEFATVPDDPGSCGSDGAPHEDSSQKVHKAEGGLHNVARVFALAFGRSTGTPANITGATANVTAAAAAGITTETDAFEQAQGNASF